MRPAVSRALPAARAFWRGVEPPKPPRRLRSAEQAARSARTLAPINPAAAADLDRLIPASALVDPERPADPELLVKGRAARARPVHGEPHRVFGVELLVLAGVAALWRWTPLHAIVTPAAIILLAFPIAGLAGVPLTRSSSSPAFSLSRLPEGSTRSLARLISRRARWPWSSRRAQDSPSSGECASRTGNCSISRRSRLVGRPLSVDAGSAPQRRKSMRRSRSARLAAVSA